jgi:hypothetical protein
MRGKSRALVLALLCAAAGMWLWRSGGSVAANDSVLQSDRAVTAALEKGDKTVASKFLDPDFSWIDSQGIMWAREDALRAGIKPLVGTENDGKVLEHAYGNGKLEWIQISQGDHYSAHIWVQRPSGWRLLHMTEIAVQKRDYKRARPNFDVPCINPCQEVPYKPLTASEQAALAGWQEQESSSEGWDKHQSDNPERAGVNTYGGVNPPKAQRIAARNKAEAANPNAPKIGAAPVLWMRSWDFGDAVFSIALQPDYGDKAYWATRIYAKNAEGVWQQNEGYHNYIQASPVMTAVPTASKSE